MSPPDLYCILSQLQCYLTVDGGAKYRNTTVVAFSLYTLASRQLRVVFDAMLDLRRQTSEQCKGTV